MPSLYLFQNQQTIDDLVGHLTTLAHHKSKSFHLSFGCSKNAVAEITYSVTIAATDLHGVNRTLVDTAAAPNELFQKIEEFLNTL